MDLAHSLAGRKGCTPKDLSEAVRGFQQADSRVGELDHLPGRSEFQLKHGLPQNDYGEFPFLRVV